MQEQSEGKLYFTGITEQQFFPHNNLVTFINVHPQAAPVRLHLNHHPDPLEV